MFKRIFCLRQAITASWGSIGRIPGNGTTRFCNTSSTPPEPSFQALLDTITNASEGGLPCEEAEIIEDVESQSSSTQDAEEPPKPETLTSICKFLQTNELAFEITNFTKNVRTTCVSCLNENVLNVSRLDGTVACQLCDYQGSFMDFKNEVYSQRERATLPRHKRSVGFIEPDESSYQLTLESGTRVFVPSTKKKADAMSTNYDDLDTDLYDRVTYLDLMNKQDERDRQRKLDQFESMRRLRDEADKLSARGPGSGANELSDISPLGPGSSGATSMVTQIDPMIRNMWNEAVDLGELRDVDDQNIFLSLRMLLGVDMITAETLSRFHIKGHLDSYDNAALCYPRYKGPSGRTRPPCGLKVIRKVGDKMEKENYPEPDEFGQARFSGIFGYHMVTPADRRIILTTNERDALAVYDSTGGMLTIALPKAERIDHSVLSFLEDFEKIYLWFPSHHQKFAQDYASYLNSSRCYIIDKQERPIELVRDNRKPEVQKAINEEAIRVRNRGFRSMIDVRNELRDEILNSNSRMYGLTQWKRFAALNKYLQGFRPGEFTVLTGATGIGKTTFLCEYSLDLLVQGVRTLFCSFEMNEEKILKWMLVQYSGLPLYRVEHHPSVEMWLDRFERTRGDLIIMKVDEFRKKSIIAIVNAIRDQIVSSGIQHVVIDNLQFLIGMVNLYDDKATSLDRFNQQDRFVGLMRKIANDYGVHVTIVVHPRKTGDEDLEMHHFGGSARVTQEADNVLAIQKRKGEEGGKQRKFLYILKNRFGGKRVDGDTLELLFQRPTYTHILQDNLRK